MDARVTVKQNSDFRRIYRRGRSAVSGGVVVYCLKNRQGMSRLGVTVSTKLGHAVVRNRVRRRFRELNSSQQNCVLPAYSITKRLFAQIDAFHVNMLDFVLGKIVVAGTFDLRCVSKAFEKNTRKPRFRE